MKYQILTILTLLMVFCTSCIQNEPLSPYADIEEFTLPDHVKISDATINQANITVYIRKDVDLTSIVPTKLVISEGATIEPSADTPRDFSTTVKYLVTAADGVRQREYTIQPIKSALYEYDFEDWETYSASRPYDILIGYDADGNKLNLWDSSNTGTSFYQNYESSSGYPVHKTTSAAEGAYAAELVTQAGPGNIFNIINIPIAAGSLFTGIFEPLNALRDPLTATQFGQPFYDRPTRFTGVYKYKAGTGNYIDPDGSVNPVMKDSCAIYAVFYKSDSNLDRLDGNNVLTHPNIVALAMLPPEARAGSAGDEFVPFDIDFDYDTYGHTVDFTANDYKLGIVMSSSFYGNRYEGVIGSRLVADDLMIICEEENEEDDEA